MNALLSQIAPLADSPARRNRGDRRSAGSPGIGQEELRFPKGALRSMVLGSGEVVKLRVLQGLWWLTMEGDPTDYAADAGSELRFIGPGVLLLEALGDENRLLIEV